MTLSMFDHQFSGVAGEGWQTCYGQLVGPASSYDRSAMEMVALQAEGDPIHILLPEQLNTIHGAFITFGLFA
jgi:hypothetical protein